MARIFITEITLYQGYGLRISVLCNTVGTDQTDVAVISWIWAREVSGSDLSCIINDRLLCLLVRIKSSQLLRNKCHFTVTCYVFMCLCVYITDKMIYVFA